MQRDARALMTANGEANAREKRNRSVLRSNALFMYSYLRAAQSNSAELEEPMLPLSCHPLDQNRRFSNCSIGWIMSIFLAIT